MEDNEKSSQIDLIKRISLLPFDIKNYIYKEYLELDILYLSIINEIYSERCKNYNFKNLSQLINNNNKKLINYLIKKEKIKISNNLLPSNHKRIIIVWSLICNHWSQLSHN